MPPRHKQTPFLCVFSHFGFNIVGKNESGQDSESALRVRLSGSKLLLALVFHHSHIRKVLFYPKFQNALMYQSIPNRNSRRHQRESTLMGILLDRLFMADRGRQSRHRYRFESVYRIAR